MGEVALEGKVLGRDGVEWGTEEVGEGEGMFLVAASQWEESLGPVYLPVRAVLEALPHASDIKRSWLGDRHQNLCTLAKHVDRCHWSSSARSARPGTGGMDGRGQYATDRRRSKIIEG